MTASLDLLRAARRYIRECLDHGSPTRVSEFATRLGLSRTRLNQLFLAAHAVTVTEFLKREQLRVAKRLLCYTDLSITEVAHRAAFGTRRTLHASRVLACHQNNAGGVPTPPD